MNCHSFPLLSHRSDEIQHEKRTEEIETIIQNIDEQIRKVKQNLRGIEKEMEVSNLELQNFDLLEETKRNREKLEEAEKIRQERMNRLSQLQIDNKLLKLQLF